MMPRMFWQWCASTGGQSGHPRRRVNRRGGEGCYSSSVSPSLPRPVQTSSTPSHRLPD
ncbi:hypothetical protein E2C01_092610 [Portunus trituberculatus]|uniref:Uncharacterized protein n=1 Tax=Portunus trituberculatus TaxID=210409 RepID=A0A5B7JGW0_PORTR|nr:hypothetical protein [Portunus trituberculatus]